MVKDKAVSSNVKDVDECEVCMVDDSEYTCLFCGCCACFKCYCTFLNESREECCLKCGKKYDYEVMYMVFGRDFVHTVYKKWLMKVMFLEYDNVNYDMSKCVEMCDEINHYKSLSCAKNKHGYKGEKKNVGEGEITFVVCDKGKIGKFDKLLALIEDDVNCRVVGFDKSKGKHGGNKKQNWKGKNKNKKKGKKYMTDEELEKRVNGNSEVVVKKICKDYCKVIFDECEIDFGELEKNVYEKFDDRFRDFMLKQWNFLIGEKIGELQKTVNKIKQSIGSSWGKNVKSTGTCEKCLGIMKKYKCEKCDYEVCRYCEKELNGDHECNDDDVKTVKVLRKSVKNCPKCRVPIYRLEGCKNMFCVRCKVFFDWETGRICLKSGIENPHVKGVDSKLIEVGNLVRFDKLRLKLEKLEVDDITINGVRLFYDLLVYVNDELIGKYLDGESIETNMFIDYKIGNVGKVDFMMKLYDNRKQLCFNNAMFGCCNWLIEKFIGLIEMIDRQCDVMLKEFEVWEYENVLREMNRVECFGDLCKVLDKYKEMKFSKDELREKNKSIGDIKVRLGNEYVMLNGLICKFVEFYKIFCMKLEIVSWVFWWKGGWIEMGKEMRGYSLEEYVKIGKLKDGGWEGEDREVLMKFLYGVYVDGGVDFDENGYLENVGKLFYDKCRVLKFVKKNGIKEKDVVKKNKPKAKGKSKGKKKVSVSSSDEEDFEEDFEDYNDYFDYERNRFS